jgi:phosphatidylinositol kinase/protein kinase (PI-3  family)
MRDSDEPGVLETELFTYFKMLLYKCFLAARKHRDYICELINLMSQNSPLGCFKSFRPDLLKERFFFNLSDQEVSRTSKI